MKIRLALIVLVLVILPTAILSLAAGRALRHWELVLEREREINAANAIETAVKRIKTRLEDDLEQVRSAMLDCLRRSSKFQDLNTTADRLQKSNANIKRVFLFTNPWGFLYPQDPTDVLGDKLRPGWDYIPPENQISGENERLLMTLRQEVASSGNESDIIWLKVDDNFYCFSSVESRKNLYAGYEINMDGFGKELSHVVSGISGGGIHLTMSGPMIPEKSKIVISDSLSGQSASGSRTASGFTERPLAERNLFFPFNLVKIAAFTGDPAEIIHAAKVRARLYGWGILLLAGVIVGATWLVLREAGLEIQRARARSDFVMGVSHDLRTPVSSMKMLAESLYLEHVHEAVKRKEFLGTIVRECDRLADMIERVLFFMRQENKAVVYSFTNVNAENFIGTLLQSFKERNNRGHGREFKLQVLKNNDANTDTPVLMIRIDKTAMSQVIFNLMDNAVKYSPDGTPVRITVERVFRKCNRSMIKISVCDEGEGIARNEISKIFRPFYRINPEARDNVGGVGLGLSLCRKITKKHGGRIEVQSEPGKGSIFSILLPEV